MINWEINKYGNKIFTHEGWEVKIYNWEGTKSHHEVEVNSPTETRLGGCSSACHEVTVCPEGIWVNGTSNSSWEELSSSWEESPSAFTIPWKVLEAIFEAKREAFKA